MTKRRRRNVRWISWVILLILLAGTVCYLVWENYFKDEKPVLNEGEKTEPEVTPGVPEEEKLPDGEPVVKEEVVQYDGDNPNNSGELSGAVTYSEVSGDYLVIRVNIDQYLNSGTCRLRLEEFGSEIYHEAVNLVSSVTTATCEGFNIPLRATGTGEFKIFVDIESGGKKGLINGEVVVR